MGYTHYWKKGRNITDEEWSEITHQFKIALSVVTKDRGIPIVGWDGMGIFDITPASIAFNGYGEDSYESAFFTKEPSVYEFCKTDREPYDLLVCLTLILIHNTAFGALIISSDGDSRDQEWQEAATLARTLWGRDVQIPVEGEFK